MKKVWIFFSVLQFALSSLFAQTTVMISSTVAHSGEPRFGVNIGGDSFYGSEQLLKDLLYGDNPYMSSFYWRATFPCKAGGTNDTTHWFNNSAQSSGYYPANFWVGATYNAINASTGTSYGTGTITASSANSSGGIQFTLGAALSSACSTSNPDMLVVSFTNASPTLQTPKQDEPAPCASATWDTSDTDPASTNTTQSLEMPTGCTLQYGIDAVLANATNTNSTLAGTQIPWINLNGAYSAVFMAKCPASSGTSTLTVSLKRVGGTTYIASTPETLTCNSTSGAGWQTFTINFTANETGAQTSLALFDLTCIGTCLVQEVHVYEGSTLSGNTTPFRDSVVRKLQALNPGSLRFMDSSDWCSDVADLTGPQGNLRTCNGNDYGPWTNANGIGMSYDTRLQLCAFIGADCWITIGDQTTASEWANLITWLSTDPSYIALKNAGHTVYLEDGNENWNYVPGSLWAGEGGTYGYYLGSNMAAAKAATGYDSTHMKLVGNSWNAPNQGYGPYGWVALMMKAAGCTSSAHTNCPDYVGDAPYMLNYLASFATSGSNVSTTGAPFLDEWAEIANIDSVTTPPANATSIYKNASYMSSTYNVGTAVYEVNYSTSGYGATPTQLQEDQMISSVGTGLATVEHLLTMQRDSGVTGPINVFTLAQNSYSSTGGTAIPLWGIERYMACGPGQLSSCADADRPTSIAMQIVNNAIGSNNNLMSTSQSGTPTFSYAGGQPQSGTNTILANSSVPYVNCYAYANSTKTNWTTICFNNNLSSSESITLAGAGAPVGSVMQTTFPGPTNLITDNNEDTYLGSGSIAPVVTVPTPTTTSGTSYTIPPASFITLTYSTSSTPTPAPPTNLNGSPSPNGL